MHLIDISVLFINGREYCVRFVRGRRKFLIGVITFRGKRALLREVEMGYGTGIGFLWGIGADQWYLGMFRRFMQR
jgi:hypothetical protein